MRKRKIALCRSLLGRIASGADEDWLWDNMRPVGREFGSPDFERLMDKDRRNGVGVFDPELKGRFLRGVSISEDMPVQPRKRL
ncbi:hypothetical protein [Roseateles toxinivorans]|uniref:hypothetical protein n=1 Tax=Roseateles toxinivorans TaxID=270368 RepID=UPI001414F5C9|nr:hypothetical protein [Roseateles toxinivorans]